MEDLVAAIRAGDRQAEERLVELFGRGVSIILDRHTGGGAEAQDLFQDTFRLVLEKLRKGELREPPKLPGFVAQIARSLAIEHYRRQRRRKTEPAGDDLPVVPAPDASPLTQLLAAENAALVRRVIQDLANVRDRQILVRFYLAEEDKDRIAGDYGLTSLQLNRVLHRARQRYKELYEARSRRSPAPGLAPGIIAVVIPLSVWMEWGG
jgi:RNA polymerase sigma-70 factor (ECF subfamily)